MKAMILAAGRGERMRPLTDLLPKPLLAVGGKPLIVHHIEKLKSAGVTELVINHAWLGHKLVEVLGDGSALGVTIHWSAEESALETAGGIVQALPLLGAEPFLVINGDTWLDLDYHTLVSQPLGDDLAHLWLVPNAPHHPKGDFVLTDAGRAENPGADDPRPRLTYCSVALLKAELFREPFCAIAPGNPQGTKMPLVQQLRAAMQAGRCGATRYDGTWVDVGTPERLAAINA